MKKEKDERKKTIVKERIAPRKARSKSLELEDDDIDKEVVKPSRKKPKGSLEAASGSKKEKAAWRADAALQEDLADETAAQRSLGVFADRCRFADFGVHVLVFA